MRMSLHHKLNDLLNVASRETGYVKMSSNSEKINLRSWNVRWLARHDTNCLGNEGTVTCGFIHIVAF